MNPRTNYEMTQEDLNKILEACKPVPYMVVGGRPPSSPQENANRAWASLGKKMGFDSMTVQPSGKGRRFFTAVPSETEAQREARVEEQKELAKQERIDTLTKEILSRKTELAKLRGGDTV
jgi:hypothetical protein